MVLQVVEQWLTAIKFLIVFGDVLVTMYLVEKIRLNVYGLAEKWKIALFLRRNFHVHIWKRIF